MIELYSNQKNPYSLNKTEKDIIRDFAQNHNNKAATQAKGFMQYFYEENLFEKTTNSARMAQFDKPAGEKERDNNLERISSINTIENSMLFSPNPAKDFVNIQLKNINQDIVITDTNGKLIKSIKANASHIKIDVSDIKPGLYFVRFDSHHKKFVVER
jgi:hypothetical protein